MTPRRITVVTGELLGYDRTGGAGTATTFLALALARMKHRVDILYVGKRAEGGLDPEWARLYREAGTTVRVPPRSEERFEAELFARMHAVELELRRHTPDVVIAHEFWAPAYTALCLRRLGLAFERTLFVVICHGTWRWVKHVNRTERVFAGVLRESVLEQASVELADVVVSPSAYLLGWMRDESWHVPKQAFVIPYVTRSHATGEARPEPRRLEGDGRVERLAFFGRLEERKGVRPFLAGLNGLEPELLERVELEFIGRATPAWAPDVVQANLAESTRHALRGVTFETELDQGEALARLARAGTLAVMPSLGDNSPNTIYECLERGIPFIASNVGGVPELIAPEDRGRVLFAPTAEGVEDALRRALSHAGALRPARPAFDDAVPVQRWAEIVAMEPPEPAGVRTWPAVDVIVVHRESEAALARCLAALERQSYTGMRVIVEATREAGLQAAEADWVLFLDEEDVPADELLQTLVRAQAASGADVVTCGVYLEREERERVQHVYLGDPKGLGLLSNGYGAAALLRLSLLDDKAAASPVAGDPAWPLLAGLAFAGARVVSIPLPLVTRSVRPGSLEREPADALPIVELAEHALPRSVRSLARLAAGLAAEQRPSPAPNGGLAERALRVLRDDGPLELARRARRRYAR